MHVRLRSRVGPLALFVVLATAAVATGCTAPTGATPGTARPIVTAVVSPGPTVAASATAAVSAAVASPRAPTGTASASPPATPAPPPAAPPAGVPAAAEPATISRVVDGDTIDVVLHGDVLRVRLILVDTPEVFGTVGCYGEAASAFTRATVPPGAPVYLERDVSQTDQYGRLLRYVYLADGTMLNELLARDGYGRLATFPPDLRYRARIAAAAAAARAEGAGLWGACGAAAAAGTPASAVAGTPAPGGAAASTCDPSYPDACIPPPPPDLDCADIPYRRFRVVGSDPHHFDGDHNGIGCESN